MSERRHAARTRSAAWSLFHTLLHTNSSSRATPPLSSAAAIASPTSSSLPYTEAQSMWRYPARRATCTAARTCPRSAFQVPSPTEGRRRPSRSVKCGMSGTRA